MFIKSTIYFREKAKKCTRCGKPIIQLLNEGTNNYINYKEISRYILDYTVYVIKKWFRNLIHQFIIS